MRHRYYAPSQGRFITRDPLGYVNGLNLYEFVAGSPHNLRDPLGLDWATDTLCFAQELEGRRNAVQQLPQIIGGGRVNQMLDMMTFAQDLASSLMYAMMNNPQIIMGMAAMMNNPQAVMGIGGQVAKQSPSFTACLSKCAGEHFWPLLTGSILSVGGLPIIPYGLARFIGWGRPLTAGWLNYSKATLSGATSIWSILFRRVLPWSVPTPPFYAPTLAQMFKGQFSVPARTLGGFLGRLLPWIGAGILLYDVGSISLCTYRCMQSK